MSLICRIMSMRQGDWVHEPQHLQWFAVSYASCRDESGLPSASRLTLFVKELVENTVSKIRVSLDAQGECPSLSCEEIDELREALITACVGGYLGGFCVRQSIVRTLKATLFCAVPCHHPGCLAGPNCWGNRLELIPSQSLPEPLPDVDGQTRHVPVYRYVAPHHKTTHRGKSPVYINIYNWLMTIIISIWEMVARPQVRRKYVI
jgi:hypothetical protein